MKHTPGPWTVHVETERGCCGEDIGIEILLPEINRLLHSSEWADPEDWDRDLANAQLIAAAPDMLEALKAALPYIEKAYECAFPNEAENLEVLGMALGAIEKAEGK